MSSVIYCSGLYPDPPQGPPTSSISPASSASVAAMSVVDTSSSPSSLTTALEVDIVSAPLGPKGSASIVHPPHHIIPSSTVHPQRLGLLEPPPCRLSDYPRVPSRRRHPRFDPQGHFSVSTHIFPAAYPRNRSCGTWRWPPPPVSASASERKKYAQAEVERMAARKEAMEGRQFQPENSRDVLYMVANRYVNAHRRTRSGGVTLVLVHGAGVHKETWEPFLHSLIQNIHQSHSHLEIHDIWALESVQHGDSGLVNESALGDTFDCTDYSRDILNFLMWYMPENELTSNGSQFSSPLPRLSNSEAHRRATFGFRNHKVIGVGHSIGACGFVYPAVEYPALFSGLIFAEGMTLPEYIRFKDKHRRFEALCLLRQHTFNSREETLDVVQKSAYYRSWDPRVVESYLIHAVTQCERTGQIKLKTHPYLEALMLLERRIVYETWELLPHIPSRIPMLWVNGSASQRTGGPEARQQTVWKRPRNTQNVLLSGIGHMLVQEAPDELAKHTFEFLEQNFVSLPEHYSKL